MIVAIDSPGQVILAAVTIDDWVIAAGLMAGSLVATLVIRQIVRSLTSSLRFQAYVTTLITRSVGSILVLVSAVYALRQLEVEVGPLLGALGIGGFVIVLSLQHVLFNLVGSVVLHARRPIRRGDQIHSNGHSGTVIDINSRAVVLMTFDGERVFLPNLRVLDEPLVNQTAEEFRRTSLPVDVSYDTDLRDAENRLTTALRGLDVLQDAPPADVIVTAFGESGVSLVARFWHSSEELTARWVISEVAIAIRETLSAANITIPFPQRVLHLADRMVLDPSSASANDDDSQ